MDRQHPKMSLIFLFPTDPQYSDSFNFQSIPFYFQKVPQYAANLYDAVLWYAMALNKTICQKKDIRDGRAVVKNLIGVTHKSKLSY